MLVQHATHTHTYIHTHIHTHTYIQIHTYINMEISEAWRGFGTKESVWAELEIGGCVLHTAVTKIKLWSDQVVRKQPHMQYRLSVWSKVKQVGSYFMNPRGNSATRMRSIQSNTLGRFELMTSWYQSNALPLNPSQSYYTVCLFINVYNQLLLEIENKFKVQYTPSSLTQNPHIWSNGYLRLWVSPLTVSITITRTNSETSVMKHQWSTPH